MGNTLERDNTTKPNIEIPPRAPAHLVVDVDLYALPDDHIDPQIAWKRFGMFDKGPRIRPIMAVIGRSQRQNLHRWYNTITPVLRSDPSVSKGVTL